MRLTRQDLRRVHVKAHTKFLPGIFPMLKSGSDIAVFATGGTVQNALGAARELKALGIDVRVYNASSLKPVDRDAIHKAGLQTKLLVTFEDHNIIGGLGGAVAETLSSFGNMPPLIRAGINDDFGESGTPEALYEKHGLSQEKMAEHLAMWWREYN